MTENVLKESSMIKKGLYNRCFLLYFVIFSRTADLYERLVLLIKFFKTKIFAKYPFLLNYNIINI